MRHKHLNEQAKETNDESAINIFVLLIVGWRKPVKTMNRVELKRGSRSTLNAIKKTIGKGRYRKDLKMVMI